MDISKHLKFCCLVTAPLQFTAREVFEKIALLAKDSLWGVRPFCGGPSPHGRVTTLSNRFGDLLADCGLRQYKPHHIIVADGRDGRWERYALSFHCLRYAAVTLLKEAGVPQAAVQELIGHESPAISQLYTKVGLEALKKACAAMPAV